MKEPRLREKVYYDPENLDRDKVLKAEDRSQYLWCLHCERTYRRGEYRLVRDLQMCPYPDCSGDTVIDGWDWAKVREELPQYPEVPEHNVVYPLYPERSNSGGGQ